MNQDIKENVYQAIAEVTSDDFAFSYFVKARQVSNRITPHTVTAWRRILKSVEVMKLFKQAGLILVRPRSWSPERDKPERPSAVTALLARPSLPHQDKAQAA